MAGRGLVHKTTPPPLTHTIDRTCFTRVEDLRLKQEGLLKDRLTKVGKHSEEAQKEEEFATDSDSDIEYDELLDWRKKRT